MIVGAEFFNSDHKYEVTCKATLEDKNLVGGIKSRYDSFDFEEEFFFTVIAEVIAVDGDQNSTDNVTEGMMDHETGVVYSTDF